MDVIERYLGAIRRNLPRDKAEDIVAELRDVIASHVEDREARSGAGSTTRRSRTCSRRSATRSSSPRATAGSNG